jgi:hypothetical protein
MCYSHLQFFHKSVYVLLLGWFLVFILFLGAFTGLVVLLIVSPFALLFWFSFKKNLAYKKWTYISIAGLLVIILIYLSYSLYRFYDREKITCELIDSKTVNGNEYVNWCDKTDYENKSKVWLFVCDKELMKEWPDRSSIPYTGVDQKGQNIRTTLIRYMSSLGYRKDSAGLAKLTSDDIKMIEEGYTNYIYKNKLSIYPRIYELLWEIEQYAKNGNPSGHSLTQRFEFVKNAMGVIKRHFWFGTGTGDVKYEIDYQYEIDKSVLSEQWQLRAHNQLVTFLLAFGIIGFIWIVFCTARAIYLDRNNIDFISFSYLLILFLSMFNEDTFETQVGAVFFSFFFSLFLLSRNLRSKTE